MLRSSTFKKGVTIRLIALSCLKQNQILIFYLKTWICFDFAVNSILHNKKTQQIYLKLVKLILKLSCNFAVSYSEYSVATHFENIFQGALNLGPNQRTLSFFKVR